MEDQMGRWLGVGLIGMAVMAFGTPAVYAAAQKIDFPLRGKPLTVTLYRPAGTPRGTIVMGSGDVGWVGLAVTMAEEFSGEGYIVAGFNVRQYLSSFTRGKEHLGVQDPAADFRALRDLLNSQDALRHPVVLSGVSEGAALAVLVASDSRNHEWVDGVITMGVPPSAELAWRWTDFTAWITKGDAAEPSFAPRDFVGGIAPIPLAMIQSRTDEYVSEADYTRLLATAREPKKLFLIDASNHRFTDRRPELREAYRSALAWVTGSFARGAGK
jgi:alpha-beta hydrolase superfamily lysophospholipase